MTAECRVCGRPLRSEASRTRGVGPVCARTTGAGLTGRGTRRDIDERPEPGPGQTALDLHLLQPTLWSL